MIKVKYNIGSKTHEKEFQDSKELGDWIMYNYSFRIIDIDVISSKENKTKLLNGQLNIFELQNNTIKRYI